MKKIRFGIVEDDPSAQAWLKEALASRNNWSLVWLCNNLQAAQAHVAQADAAVDVLLVDLGLPDGSGIEVIAQAAQCWPQCLSLVVSVFGDERRVLASIQSGAKGYLLKGLASPELCAQVDELLAGGSPMSPGIARLIWAAVKNNVSAPAEVFQGSRALSAREREVIQLIARGYNYQEIAELFQVAPSTVKSQIKNIYDKLQVHSRTEAVYEARRYGWVS